MPLLLSLLASSLLTALAPTSDTPRGLSRALPEGTLLEIRVESFEALKEQAFASPWARLLDEPEGQGLRESLRAFFPTSNSSDGGVETEETPPQADPLSLLSQVQGALTLAVTHLELGRTTEESRLEIALLAHIGPSLDSFTAEWEACFSRLAKAQGVQKSVRTERGVETSVFVESLSEDRVDELTLQYGFTDGVLIATLVSHSMEAPKSVEEGSESPSDPAASDDSASDESAKEEANEDAAKETNEAPEPSLFARLVEGLESPQGESPTTQETADHQIALHLELGPLLANMFGLSAQSQSQTGEAPSAEAPPPAGAAEAVDDLQRAYANYGLDRIGRLEAEVRLDAKETAARLRVGMEKGSPIVAVLQTLLPQGDFATPSFAPPRARALTAAHLDLHRGLDAVLELIGHHSAEEARTLADAIDATGHSFGVDLRTELLSVLGPELGVLQVEEIEDPSVPLLALDPYVVLARLRDHDRARELIDRFVTESGLLAVAQRTDIEGHELVTLPIFPFEVSYAIVDQAVLMSTSKVTLRKVLEQKTPASSATSPSGDEKTTPLSADQRTLSAFRYGSFASAIETLLSMLVSFHDKEATPSASRDGKIRTLIDNLPDRATLEKHFPGMLTASLRVEEDGVRLDILGR